MDEGNVDGVSFYRVADPNFRAEAFMGGGRITLCLAGSADAVAASHLQIVLGRIQLETHRYATAEVLVDVRNLEFMVSSCFKHFLTWITKVREAEGGKQYHIRFLSDTKHHWQKRSLPTLQAFSQNLVAIDFDIKFAD